MATKDLADLLDRQLAAYLRHDAAAVAAFYAEGAIVESPTYGTVIGRAAIHQSHQQWFNAFPDAVVEPVGAPIVDGQSVVQIIIASGTNTGGLFGQHPTGHTVRFFGARILNVVDGQIVHEHRVLDRTGFLLQLARGEPDSAETWSLFRTVLSTTRLEHEMVVAAAIQRELLPAPYYKSGAVEIAATSLPCRAIGGDFLDYFELAQGKFAFVLGDVAGKGAPAALLAAKIQGMVAMCSEATRTPSETMRLLNKELVRRSVESRFATLFYAVLSADGHLSYCNAGHNPPLIVGRGRVARLDHGGVPVGLFGDADFHYETILLNQEDVLVAFSDGVVEALNSEGEEFGESRLLAVVDAHRDGSPTSLLNGVVKAMREFVADAEQHDDITALIFRFQGAAQNTDISSVQVV